jgi:arylsulfatase A-like enzyme
MLCGQYPRTLGCLANDDRCDVLKRVFPLARAFQDAGYLTAAFGKRHLPLKPYACDDGWAVHASHLPNESPANSYRDWLTDPADRRAFERDWAAEWGPDPAPLASRPSALTRDKTMEAFTAEHTIDFIRRAARAGKPFFCWASFFRPHQPYTPLPEYLEQFDASHWGTGRRAGDGLSLPAAFHETCESQPAGMVAHFAGSETWPIERARREEQLFRNYIACYYACLEEVDHHVGRILDALHGTGLDERTIVIYTSDHGDFVGAHGMAEKAASGHNIYLDTLRVPLIFRWAGTARRGAVCEDLAELVDLYPTLLALAGIEPPRTEFDLAGRNIAETLTAGRPTGRQYAVSESWAQKTVITRDRAMGIWQDPLGKQTDQRGSAGDMLFDLDRDPHQIRNVYEEAAYAADRVRLAGMLREWEGRTPDVGKRSHAAWGDARGRRTGASITGADTT